MKIPPGLRLLFVCAFLGSFAPPLQARNPGDPPPTPSGIYGSAVELNINGSLTLYVLENPGANNGGGTVLIPTGSTATLNESSWGNSSESSPTLNLGTFVPALGQSLLLTGGSLLTFDGDSNVTDGFLDFRIFQSSPSGTFTEFSLPINATNVSGSPARKRWASETQTYDLLAGLPVGTYVLGVYLRDSATDGASFSRVDGTNNFGATFTVADVSAVPEPSSPIMLIGGIGIVAAVFLRRQRRAVV